MTKKEQLLRKFNEAFAQNDIEQILDNVTDDIRWTITGDCVINGREAFREALLEMAGDDPFNLSINDIITHGDSASVNGTMEAPDGKTYAFCDIYKLQGLKNPKVKEMTSYVIKLKTEMV
ncbi:MAG: nuclear transport factor 2 family protein [Balneolaceae bacterium]|nr:nuclear transport factor 2 family protein [Balneolaceae bacterium]